MRINIPEKATIKNVISYIVILSLRKIAAINTVMIGDVFWIVIISIIGESLIEMKNAK